MRAPIGRLRPWYWPDPWPTKPAPAHQHQAGRGRDRRAQGRGPRAQGEHVPDRGGVGGRVPGRPGGPGRRPDQRSFLGPADPAVRLRPLRPRPGDAQASRRGRTALPRPTSSGKPSRPSCGAGAEASRLRRVRRRGLVAALAVWGALEGYGRAGLPPLLLLNPSPSLPLGLYAYAGPRARGPRRRRHVGAPARLRPPRRPRPQARDRRRRRHLLLGSRAAHPAAQRHADAAPAAGRRRGGPAALDRMPAARPGPGRRLRRQPRQLGLAGSSASSPSRTWPASTSTSGEAT